MPDCSDKQRLRSSREEWGIDIAMKGDFSLVQDENFVGKFQEAGFFSFRTGIQTAEKRQGLWILKAVG